MYTKYGIAYAESIEELVQQVNDLLQNEDGWTLFGTMGIDSNAKGDKIYFQTMVIEKNKDFP